MTEQKPDSRFKVRIETAVRERPYSTDTHITTCDLTDNLTGESKRVDFLTHDLLGAVKAQQKMMEAASASARNIVERERAEQALGVIEYALDIGLD